VRTYWRFNRPIRTRVRQAAARYGSRNRSPPSPPTGRADSKHLAARIHRILHSGRSRPANRKGLAALAVITSPVFSRDNIVRTDPPAGDREAGIAEQREQRRLRKRQRLQKRESPKRRELRERKDT